MTLAGRISILFGFTLFLFGCSSENKSDYDNSSSTPQTAQNQSPQEMGQTVKDDGIQYELSGIPFDLSGKPVSIAGITFTPAIQWEDLGAADMRAANYKFGPLVNDEQPAEMAVYYFGQGQGGSIEANVQRWIKQMSMPDGRDPATAAIRYTMQVNGMPAHVLTLYGIFNEPVGGMMSGKSIARENYRLVGVIVEAPQGNVFFKLTGPDYTAKIMVEAFITMVKQVQRVS